MADWGTPQLTSLYTDVITELKARDEDLARMFDGVTASNLQAGTIRWNSTNKKFEIYDGISTWSDLALTYSINVDKLNGQPASYYLDVSNVTAGILPAGHFDDTSHGSRGGGSLHALATQSAHGFLSSSDKQIIDNLNNNFLQKNVDQTTTGNITFNAASPYLVLKPSDVAATSSVIRFDYNDGRLGALVNYSYVNEQLEFLTLTSSNFNTSTSFILNRIGEFSVKSGGINTTEASLSATFSSEVTIHKDLVLNSYAWLENKQHTISWNDGGGNFNIRAGHYFSSVNSQPEFSGTSGAIHIALNHEYAIPEFRIQFSSTGTGQTAGSPVTFVKPFVIRADGTLHFDGNKIWHAGNDGSGSGLDADLLDGLDSSAFFKLSTNNTTTGILTVQNILEVQSGTPTIKLNDTDSNPFWLYVNNGKFYVLTDRDNDGVWETPNPLELDNSLAEGLLYGNTVWTSGNIATQLEAEEGVDNTKGMTPLRVKQAIRKVSGVTVSKVIDGALAGIIVITTDGDAYIGQPLDATSKYTAFDYKVNFPESVTVVDGAVGGGTDNDPTYCGHYTFLDSNGNIWVMGVNNWGDLGLGHNTTPILTPKKITPPSGTAITKVVSFGVSHNQYAGGLIVLTDDGRLWGTGYNAYGGVLGQGNTTNSNVFVEIPQQGGQPWTDVVAFGGSYASALMKNANGWYATGYNGYGQLGIGTVTSANVPTKVLAIDPNSVPYPDYATVNGKAVYWLQPDGTVMSCGYNGHGQLGIGTTITTTTPTLITGLTNVTDIFAVGGNYAAVFFKTNTNSLYACGYNGRGQLGTGDTINKTSPALVGTYDVIDMVKGNISHSGCVTYMVTSDGKIYAAGYDGLYATFSPYSTNSKTTFTEITRWIKDPKATSYMPVKISAGGFYSTYHQNFLWMIDANGHIYAGGQLGAVDGTKKFGFIGIGSEYVSNIVPNLNENNLNNIKFTSLTYQGQLGSTVK